MQRSIVRYFQPVVKWLCQTRNIQLTNSTATKPVIKIAEDKFQITVDVRQYSYEELLVKAGQDYVVVKGKQERPVPNGCMVRQFVRKFRLPEGCDPIRMESKLSDQGFLTITAYRMVSEPKCNPCEKCINIVRTQNLCDAFINNTSCSDDYPPHTPNEVYLPIYKDTSCQQESNPPPPPTTAQPPTTSQPPSDDKKC